MVEMLVDVSPRQDVAGMSILLGEMLGATSRNRNAAIENAEVNIRNSIGVGE